MGTNQFPLLWDSDYVLYKNVQIRQQSPLVSTVFGIPLFVCVVSYNLLYHSVAKHIQELALIEYLNRYNFEVRLKQIDYMTPADYLKNKFNKSIQPIVC